MNMSFALTMPQFKARAKTVTRRIGWLRLKAGDVLYGIEKGQGLKKGERIQHLGRIRVLDVRREPLNRMIVEPEYGRQECVKEGFSGLTPGQFVVMFCESHRVKDVTDWPEHRAFMRRCDPYDLVTRIEYEYLDEVGG